ncbi:hypothetical protein [Sphingomonas sp. 28-62-11]|uniref:hypothetical protein n=1 Tax=Sphingomonas sp. 28-62-11 TaxID=1970432 RepID=UPI000BC813DA|nr:MAG: hypothetical protein B7Y49_04930 [Sphingomonas sp. 28-62-11]
MFNKSSLPREPRAPTEFSVGVPRRHDAIGSALSNAYTRVMSHEVPSEMSALLAQLDRHPGTQNATE